MRPLLREVRQEHLRISAEKNRLRKRENSERIFLKTYRGAKQAAEKLRSGEVLYQGTTSVVPKRQHEDVGL
jgi:hypothetical protein